MKGRIFNIQKYSIHDGPGIRTTVFLKGCPLDCWWCHNPESQEMGATMLSVGQKCIGCGQCVGVCQQTDPVENVKANLHSMSCTRCGNCSEICPTESRMLAGKEYTVSEVMKEIEKDTVFYEQSGGGVTFSGGEPFAQPEFLKALVQACKKKRIHVTVDTSGFANPKQLMEIAGDVDLFLYDIKSMDNWVHEKYTGVSNQLILSNLQKLVESKARIFARIPVIPTINDGQENMVATAEFLRELGGIEQVNLLPYHHISSDKYTRMGWTYKMPETPEMTDEDLQHLSEVFAKRGLKSQIGG